MIPCLLYYTLMYLELHPACIHGSSRSFIEHHLCVTHHATHWICKSDKKDWGCSLSVHEVLLVHPQHQTCTQKVTKEVAILASWNSQSVAETGSKENTNNIMALQGNCSHDKSWVLWMNFKNNEGSPHQGEIHKACGVPLCSVYPSSCTMVRKKGCFRNVLMERN